MITRDDLIDSSLKNYLPSLQIRNLIKDYASEFQVTFSLPASILHIMDNLLNGIPTFFREHNEYANAWEEKFGMDEWLTLLEENLNKYRLIRRHYQKYPKYFEPYQKSMDEDNGLFSPNPQEIVDPIMYAFCSCDTISEALDVLSGVLSRPDLDYLKKFFSNFDKMIKILIGDIKPYLDCVTDINSELVKSDAFRHLRQMRDFYCANAAEPHSIKLVWSLENCSGICYGDNILVRVPANLLRHKNDLQTYKHNVFMISSIIIHEATHHISGNMVSSKKKELTQAFLRHVSLGGKPHFLFELEEPLVMATQMLYIKRNSDIKKSWFNDRLAKYFLFFLEEHLNSGQPLNTDFIEKCAKIAS